jgi:hypothetical protein
VAPRQGRLNERQVKALSDELTTLMKQQSDARLTDVFIRMIQKEIDAFDLRQERISRKFTSSLANTTPRDNPL